MVVLAQLNALIRALHEHTKCQARLPNKRLEQEFYDASAASDDERLVDRVDKIVEFFAHITYVCIKDEFMNHLF